MLRVTTLHASSAAATAAYYADYLTKDVSEPAGVWAGAQAAGLGLTGEVTVDALAELLAGRDPTTGTPLGAPLVDRFRADGRVVRAVAGFDATFSAPKSLSVLWGLSGDERFAECHDLAVTAVAEYLERFGATTRIRSNGARLHPDTHGLTMAAFRQSTSRLDDPQLHTHLIISSKVQTADGRWLALDARMLMRHQRALGGLYHSVLRAEVTSRFGLAFEPIVNGQAEIAGIPATVLEQFSKRARQVDTVTAIKVADFVAREGREPSKFERAAMEREASADTRGRKTGRPVAELRERWIVEAATHSVTPKSLLSRAHDTARDTRLAVPKDSTRDVVTVGDVIDHLTEHASTWHRLDVLRAICDLTPARPGIDGRRWAKALDRAVDAVLDQCIDLDPTTGAGARRGSDGRSVWTEPVANRFTSTKVLEQERSILEFATQRAAEPSAPSATVERGRLDVLQAEAAGMVAGGNGLVVIIGPAGAGKTTMLTAAITDLHTHHRAVYGIAPTGKAAHVLARETGIPADTVAKLLHEWRPDGPGPQPAWQLAAGTTVIVDEAGLVATGDLHRLTQLAERERWRVVLVGDPRQLAAIGRGGMFDELARTGPTIELEQLYRFSEPWEADATLRLRAGDPHVLDTYLAYDRIRAGTLDDHLTTLTTAWLDQRRAGGTLAISVATNEHAALVNTAIQTARLAAGELAVDRHTDTASGPVYVGDVIATRHNQRDLQTSNGAAVRNRDRWTITNIDQTTGAISAARLGAADTITLPPGYAAEWVELAYAATDYGNQGDTFTASANLISDTTTARGLYVAMTRGQHHNLALVITPTPDPNEARDTLTRVLATDRADTPATVQQRQLAATAPPPPAPAPPPTKPAPTPLSPPLTHRASIPDWFDHYRTAIRRELDDAIASAEHLAIRNHQRMTELQQLQDALRAAEQTCRPIDRQLDAASNLVAQRTQERRTAARDLDAASLWHRRTARQHLADATAAHDLATAALEELLERFRPQLDQRQSLHQRITELERTITGNALFDRHLDHPAHIAHLQRVAQALEHWHAWAVGGRIPAADLQETYTALRSGLEHDWLNDDPRTQLAHTLRTWADATNLQIATAGPALQLPEPDLGVAMG